MDITLKVSVFLVFFFLLITTAIQFAMMHIFLAGIRNSMDQSLEISNNMTLLKMEKLISDIGEKKPDQLCSNFSPELDRNQQLNLSRSLDANPTKISSVHTSTVKRQMDSNLNARNKFRTEVEVLSGETGTIEFDGRCSCDLRRKIWVLQRGPSYSEKRFVLIENKLGVDAHLSVWNSHGDHHVWNGSQDNLTKEWRTSGNVVLVTLTIPSCEAERPSFKLTFNATGPSSSIIGSNEVIRSDGVQTVSFNPQNSSNSNRGSFFLAVIAPSSGAQFSLSLKYMDAPGTPPNCRESSLKVWFLEDRLNEVNYDRPTAPYSSCGVVGNISEPLGNSNVAILLFRSSAMNAGTGFQVEMNTN